MSIDWPDFDKSYSPYFGGAGEEAWYNESPIDWNDVSDEPFIILSPESHDDDLS